MLQSQHVLATVLACFNFVQRCFGQLSFVFHTYSVVIFTSLMLSTLKHHLHALLAWFSVFLHAISALKSLQPPSFLYFSICFESSLEPLVGLSVKLRLSCLMVLILSWGFLLTNSMRSLSCSRCLWLRPSFQLEDSHFGLHRLKD